MMRNTDGYNNDIWLGEYYSDYTAVQMVSEWHKAYDLEFVIVVIKNFIFIEKII